MKQSLAVHGTVLRNRNITPSSDARRPTHKLYTEWMESKFGKAGMQLYQPDSPGLFSQLSRTSRSKQYDAKMENLKQMSIKHSNLLDPSHLYSSDISAVKKLSIHEQYNTQSMQGSFIKKGSQKLVKDKKKASPSPTQSENRSMQKLFRRKVRRGGS